MHLEFDIIARFICFFLKYKNSLIIVLKTYLFYIIIFVFLTENIFIFFFYFRILTTHIPKIHLIIFLLISNFSKEIMYKITQINIVKRTISLLHL